MDSWLPGYGWNVNVTKTKAKAKVKNKKGTSNIKFKIGMSWVTTAAGYPKAAKASLKCKSSGYL